jgi:hypothetical protein
MRTLLEASMGVVRQAHHERIDINDLAHQEWINTIDLNACFVRPELVEGYMEHHSQEAKTTLTFRALLYILSLSFFLSGIHEA